jgi:hypothetical protein
VIELLVKRDLMDPSTVVDDGGLKTLLFYGLCHELNDSYLITLVKKNANLETKAAPVRIQRGGPAPDSSAFHVVTDILTLAIRRKWTERDLVALIDWKVRKGDISYNNKVDESKILALLYSWNYFQAVKFLVAYSLPTNFLVEGRTFLGKVLFDGGPLAREFVLGTSVSGPRVLPFDWHTKFDLHAKGDKGQTALHDLCEGEYDEDIFMRMMNLGANPYEENNDGKSAVVLLFERIQKKSGKAVPRNEKRNFERFIEKHYKPVKK